MSSSSFLARVVGAALLSGAVFDASAQTYCSDTGCEVWGGDGEVLVGVVGNLIAHIFGAVQMIMILGILIHMIPEEIAVAADSLSAKQLIRPQ